MPVKQLSCRVLGVCLVDLFDFIVFDERDVFEAEMVVGCRIRKIAIRLSSLGDCSYGRKVLYRVYGHWLGGGNVCRLVIIFVGRDEMCWETVRIIW